jgi:hypothetical protein
MSHAQSSLPWLLCSPSTTNGYCGAAPGWKDCSQDPNKCNATQIAAMVQVGAALGSAIFAAADIFRLDDHVQHIHRHSRFPATLCVCVQYERDFVNTMQGSPTFTKEGKLELDCKLPRLALGIRRSTDPHYCFLPTGNGAFIYSCHTHCASQSSAYNRFAVRRVTTSSCIMLVCLARRVK